MNNNFIEYIIKGETWRVRTRYENLMDIGTGAYGAVCSALDRQLSESKGENAKVAIKKLRKPFQTETCALRTFREIRLLKHVSHENIISLIDIFTNADTSENITEIYLVTDLMNYDLNDIIRSEKLEEKIIILITYQILRGLKYLHSANIIHRDLKPSNITVNTDCTVKIIDFGFARVETDEMTAYVVTRFYRAPEIILIGGIYTKAVDLWSVGCILVEMYTQHILFRGNSVLDQMRIILELVGLPEPAFEQEIQPEAIGYLRTLGNLNRVDFFQYFSQIHNIEAIRLIDRLLVLNPANRITANDAIQHRFLEEYHDPNDEPLCDPYVELYETGDYSLINRRGHIFHEIQTFEPIGN